VLFTNHLKGLNLIFVVSTFVQHKSYSITENCEMKREEIANKVFLNTQESCMLLY
jgi:hypothetical protein